jgi:hypothetical protein
MRNLRKLTAAVLAIALVLTSMTATFAATTPANGDKAATLKSLDLYAGKDATDPKIGLEDALTTQDSLIFLAKLFGYKADADKLTAAQVTEGLAKFDDAADIADYAKNVVAYSAINGILSGSTSQDGKKFFVGAKDTVTAARFATFILKQMGYTVAKFTESATQLSEVKGSKVSATETGDLTRDAAVGIMYGALTAEKSTGKTVIAGIVGEDAAKLAIAVKLGLIVPAVSDLAVESITALNTKQIQVVFNQAMNKDSAETESFYVIKDKGTDTKTLVGDCASLGDDGKTVTITLNNKVPTDVDLTSEINKLTNSTTAKVTVNKDIKAANGNKLVANVDKDVKVEDGFIPTVVKAEATGDYTVRLTFSEPVYGGDAINVLSSNFSAKAGTYTYYCQKATLDGTGNVINLTYSTKLVEGPVSIIVNNDGTEKATAIQDYAGYKVFKGETTINFVRDTTVPVVTVKSAKAREVVLKFSKPVKGVGIKLYHSASGAANYQAALVTKTDYTDEITFAFTKDNPVPNGLARKFFLVTSTNSGEEIIDGYGIKVPDQTLTADVAVDDTAPVVSSTELNKNISYKITFDEGLDPLVANAAANYSVKSVTDNKVITLTALYTETKKLVELTFPGNLADNTDYQLNIKKVQDIYGNKNAADIVLTFKTGDNTAPKVKDAANDPLDIQCYAVNADGKIYITYTEPMNEAQMIDKVNYMVDANNTGAYISLGDDDTVTKITDRKILIDLKTAIGAGKTPNVKIAPIMDLAGKRLYDSVDAHIVLAIGSEDVSIKSADLVAKNKIKVVFNKQMNTVSNTDISLVGLVTPGFIKVQYVESFVTNADGNSEAVLVLDKELKTNRTEDGTTILSVTTIATPSSVSVSGTTLTKNFASALGDKTAPEISKWDHDTNSSTDDVASVLAGGNLILPSVFTAGYVVPKDTTGQIVIKFTENMDPLTLSVLSFKVDGYTVQTITTGVNTIILNVKADAANTPVKTSVTQVYNVTDTSGNVFASGNTWSVTFPTTAENK